MNVTKMRDFGLRDKVVVITGGGGALGSAFARGFADNGASLAILDFNLDKAKAAATSFPAEKVKAIAVAADVSKDDQVAKAVAEVVKHFGTIDILVNAAGGSTELDWMNASDEKWQDAMTLNFTQIRRLTLAVVPGMIEH
ncbi:MAG: SDR family NAD(P)-dependent oxidoreductase, partial [Terrimicrobium sp.]